ncbi:MAG TPA: hypothetical protein VGY13_05040, partial [Solirubrobacteraceae bacterium]|nr:hypothetical protein [Solirubrobacteraceae bacterium]
MSTALMPHETAAQDRALCADVLAHLDAQIESSKRLLEVVLEQGAAIRARDVHSVVRLAGILRGEVGRRQLLEEDRSRL